MSKTTQQNAKNAKKKSENKEQLNKPVAHNRLRPERSAANNPECRRQQDYYYANQEQILANKKQYRKDVKEGKRKPVKKIKPASPSKNTKIKYDTQEERHEAVLKSNRKWYANNKERILKQQAQYGEEKTKKAKDAKKQQILDDWEKFNQEIGNR